ncbi:hypothetical protein LUZ61_019678 [Rhynchospora tenuis]|uniref:BTB domain-containing protein n=1 Tax=Rhynchospora tenuis TaxID=198213 RepID=A0AAD6EN29_9POAL|nr:hypothetical protein LUZ61_019676 [Rhynchospora tenuis]KAJ3690514.1 hypothetical protein LUZ61_019678 [Rhynchospora tenuis]
MASDSSNPVSVQIARGSYQFKVETSKTKNLGIGEFINTPKFSAGNHNWLIKYFPQGSDAENEGTYISLSLQLLTRSMSVTAEYELGLLNKYGRPTAESWVRSIDTFHKNRSWKYSRFMKRSDFESDYIRDDYFIVACSVTVRNEPYAVLKSCFIGVFPNNLATELHQLLERQKGTDVTFELEGENISAHRLILASRSAVFRAELFGPMVELNCKCIKIEDMKPLVFRAMLHFIYTDFLPDIEDLVSGGTSDMNMSSTILYQHLLVAADRYALNGLKALCEERLGRTISIDTVVSSLAVAEQHNCDYLKEECLEFILKPKNFVIVVLTKEYASLGNSCPSLLDELRRKVESAKHRK